MKLKLRQQIGGGTNYNEPPGPIIMTNYERCFLFPLILRVFFKNYGLLKLSISMVLFSKSEISKHKKHRSLLFIHQEQTIQNLTFQKQKGKASKKIEVKWTFQELQKIQNFISSFKFSYLYQLIMLFQLKQSLA